MRPISVRSDLVRGSSRPLPPASRRQGRRRPKPRRHLARLTQRRLLRPGRNPPRPRPRLIVLLHAYAGSGKTATVAEFARWYAKTGGIEGSVLWSRFEHHLSLPRLLDRLGQVFETELENAGIHWLALADDQRRAGALQILAQKPVLWIWTTSSPWPASRPARRRPGARPSKGSAAVALSLGRAYQSPPFLRDLEQAQSWYEKSLKLLAEQDRVGQAVRLTVEAPSPEEILKLAGQVYEGLSPEQIEAVERVALDRRSWFGPLEG